MDVRIRVCQVANVRLTLWVDAKRFEAGDKRDVLRGPLLAGDVNRGRGTFPAGGIREVEIS